MNLAVEIPDKSPVPSAAFRLRHAGFLRASPGIQIGAHIEGTAGPTPARSTISSRLGVSTFFPPCSKQRSSRPWFVTN
jgi:hypothetical protein